MSNNFTEDAQRYMDVLVDYCGAKVSRLSDGQSVGTGFEAWLHCGRDSFLARPMDIPGDLELSFWFRPYAEAGRTIYTIWTKGLANIGSSDRCEALVTLNRVRFDQRVHFVKTYVDDDGWIYCGMQGLVDDGTSPVDPIWSFVEEVDCLWRLID